MRRRPSAAAIQRRAPRSRRRAPSCSRGPRPAAEAGDRDLPGCARRASPRSPSRQQRRDAELEGEHDRRSPARASRPAPRARRPAAAASAPEAISFAARRPRCRRARRGPPSASSDGGDDATASDQRAMRQRRSPTRRGRGEEQRGRERPVAARSRNTPDSMSAPPAVAPTIDADDEAIRSRTPRRRRSPSAPPAARTSAGRRRAERDHGEVRAHDAEREQRARRRACRGGAAA